MNESQMIELLIRLGAYPVRASEITINARNKPENHVAAGTYIVTVYHGTKGFHIKIHGIA